MRYYILAFCLSMLIPTPLWAQFEACNSQTSKTLYDVVFIDDNTGVAVGDSGTIVRTIDAGLNWNMVHSDDTVVFSKVKFFNSQIGISVGSHMFRTDDGGVSWAKVNYPNIWFSDIEILNDSSCIVSGSPERLIKSTNYGLDWETVVSDTSDFNFQYLSFINENLGYASYFNGSVVNSILKTEDGGQTWTESVDSTGFHFTLIEDISFVSEDVALEVDGMVHT